MQNHKYRVNIIWSDEDKCYLVELPEFARNLQRGDTYAEAAVRILQGIANAQEVLELLIEDYTATGKPLPSPQTLQAA